MSPLEWSSPFPVRSDEDTAVLFVHGFLETPMSFTYLSRELADRVPADQYGTLLPGHGSSATRLRKTGRQAWCSTVRRDFNKIQSRYRHCLLCGFSLGALISYALAGELQPDGLILLAPAFRYRFSFMKWVPDTLSSVLPYVPQFGIDGLNDRELEKWYPHYVFIPLDAVSELSRLQENVEENDEFVRPSCPMLTLQSTGDWVVDHETTVTVARRTGHPESRHRLFERSNHVLHLDYDRKQILLEIVNFLEDVALR